MNEFIVITSRLFIRSIKDDDLDLVYSLEKENSVLSDFTEDEKYEELFRTAVWEETNRPNIYNGMIFLKDSEKFVGKICMQGINSELPELGIDIVNSYQNQGYGSEAIIAFCNRYYEMYGVDRVKVRIREENARSIHVFEKIGAEYDRATSYFSEEQLNMFKDKIPDADLSQLLQNSVRDYLLKLPIQGNVLNC